MARSGAVPEAAIRDLLDALRDSVPGPITPDPAPLVDVGCAAREARRFKLDVSYRLDGAPHARFSLNDKGEPQIFRERLRRLFPEARPFLQIVPAGQVQTTLGLKWGASGSAPERLSLYYEELLQSPHHETIRQAVLRLCLDAPAPPIPAGLQPISVCLDLTSGEVVSAKDYSMETLRPDQSGVPLPPALAAFRDRMPTHAVTGTRRFLHARRFAPGGAPAGRKLLWMSEAHRPQDAARAWRIVDAERARPGPWRGSPSALMDLRQSWRHDASAYLYPDLFSLDIDTHGQPRALVVYVSLK